jgi:hypothetical protein
MGQSFKITAGCRQRSLSQVEIPWGSRPYFTVSDSRLHQPGGPGPRIFYLQGIQWSSYTPRHSVPFTSLPTIRRATVEVFGTASTRLQLSNSRINYVSPFITSGRAEERSSFLSVHLSFCAYLFPRKRVLISQQQSGFYKLIRCRGNVCWFRSNIPASTSLSVAADMCFGEPLSSNGLFRLSGVMSQYFLSNKMNARTYI